jgi:hypothetical protein
MAVFFELKFKLCFSVKKIGSLAISVVGDRGSRGKRGCEFGSVRRDEIPWQQI